MGIGLEEEQGRLSKDAETIYETLSGIVEAANGNASKLILNELRLILEDKKVKEHLNLIFPYLYTAGFLAFAGKEINKENMGRVLAAVGITPKEEVAKVLLGTKVKNNIVYLYATYYLMVMGKEICKENMRSLMKALGNAVDDAAEKDVMLLYEKNLVP